MSILPDWNSIESTARFSNFLFWVSIIALLALGAAEVGTHIYGNRSSFLASRDAEAKLVQYQDRSLSLEQINEIGKELGPFAGRSIYVGSFEGHAESARVGTIIVTALNKAGIHVINRLGLVVPNLASKGMEFGIRIVGANLDRPFTDALEKSFGAPGRLVTNSTVLDATMSVDGAVVGMMILMKAPMPTGLEAQTSSH
ncbi:hypothetical protein OKW30_007403 [Paraburkholderia sp. Clong3]|uniref:hypothetical protein n=1 Tax=Paraburkholderia sp. Clong3 TaxID=2991061 RepID=UPI003D191B2A